MSEPAETTLTSDSEDGAENDESTSAPDSAEGQTAHPGTTDEDSRQVTVTADGVTVLEDRLTDRWRGISALALAAGGLGALLGYPAVLLLGVVGVAYSAYAQTAGPPGLAVAVERELDTTTTLPGEEVTVTVTVTNEGEAMLADLRIVDGVPGGLEVVSGSPRLGTALRPGKHASFQYTLGAHRGDHAFEPTTLIARDLTGGVEREATVHAAQRLAVRPTWASTATVPVREQTTHYTGRVTTDIAGEGIEFYATREYRPGDPMNRIDWNRRARTGELATLEFREERAANVMLVLDVRREAYLAPEPEATHAVERSIEAAGRMFHALLDSGDRVGITAIGGPQCWLRPGAGQDHRTRAEQLLAEHPALSPTPPETAFLENVVFNRLRRRLPRDAQVILFSSLVDDWIVEAAIRLDAHGHSVTVLSPDATNDETTGQRLARVERLARMSRLREAGVRVVDYPSDTTLVGALSAARERWSR